MKKLKMYVKTTILIIHKLEVLGWIMCIIPDDSETMKPAANNPKKRGKKMDNEIIKIITSPTESDLINEILYR